MPVALALPFMQVALLPLPPPGSGPSPGSAGGPAAIPGLPAGGSSAFSLLVALLRIAIMLLV